VRARPRRQGIGIVAAFATCLAGCFAAPSRPGNAPWDARIDGSPGNAPVAHKLASAWYASNTQSSGMTTTQYSVSIGNVPDGDLILFIANIDNGGTSVWALPTPMFHQITQSYITGDGQTLFAAWTIANNEPTTYTQPYGPGIASADATITVLDITGADPASPIIAGPPSIGGSGEDPVVMSSPGVTTAAPNSLLIFAGGADWLAQSSTATFTPPSGFDVIDAFGDEGTPSFEWTTQLVASAIQASPGPTGTHTAMMSSSPARAGTPWALDLAIKPAPR